MTAPVVTQGPNGLVSEAHLRQGAVIFTVANENTVLIECMNCDTPVRVSGFPLSRVAGPLVAAADRHVQECCGSALAHVRGVRVAA